jgi:hypothetical protein
VTAHEEMPGSRLEIVEGAGHFVALEQPERVANLILDFVATTEPARITTAQMRDVMRAHRPRRRQAS